MKYFLLVIAVAALACNQPIKGKNGVVYKTPVQYNDYIIGRQTSLMKDLMAVIPALQTDLDKADRMLDDMLVKIDTMIFEIQGMPPYKGDSAFRDAALNSFGFYKKAFGTDYKHMISLKKSYGDTSEAVNEELQKTIDNITHEEESFDKAFHNAQLNFAEKNHMKLTENDLQKKFDNIKQN